LSVKAIFAVVSGVLLMQTNTFIEIYFSGLKLVVYATKQR